MSSENDDNDDRYITSDVFSGSGREVDEGDL